MITFALFFIGVLTETYSTPVVNRRYDPNEENQYRIPILPYLDINGQLRFEDLRLPDISPRASVANVTIYLYTQKNTRAPDILPGDGVDRLRSTNYQLSKKNVFISHGWLSNYTSDVNIIIKKALLNVEDVNLFIIDWSGTARQFYVPSYNAVPVIGEIVGNFIYSMMNTYGLSSSDFYLIGHSLGAHVVGCAGARVKAVSNSLVHSIVGLDPAGPLFTISNIDNRLDSTDGDFVHIIHTNGGLLGFMSAIGHADYYPNGGLWQNGCGLDITCPHSRAYVYYAESLLTSGFVSYRCESRRNYALGSCWANHKSLMGEFEVDKEASGDYYLDTNSYPPYALGY